LQAPVITASPFVGHGDSGKRLAANRARAGAADEDSDEAVGVRGFTEKKQKARTPARRFYVAVSLFQLLT